MAIQVTVCIVYTILGILLCRRYLQSSPKTISEQPNAAGISAIALVAVFGSALLLRLVLGASVTGYETDINTFKAWAGMVDQMGMNQIYYSDVFLDYPPGYLYVLWCLEKLRQLLGLDAMGSGFTLLIKLPSIFADILCGYLLYRFAQKSGTNPLLAAGLYLFCPAVLINSTIWGQADSL